MTLVQVRSLLVRKLLGQPAAAALRYVLWRRDAKRDERAARYFAKHSRKCPIDIYHSPILSSAKSKTLFILGSGWSVNELTNHMLRHIGEHQSVGINFWFFHDFVPTAFSFDAGKVPQGLESHTEELLVTLGRLLARQQVCGSKPQVLYLRPYNSNSGYLVPCPPEWTSWITGRANLLSRSPEAVEADLRFVTTRVARGEAPSGALPDNGSSVVRLIFLALAQGFKDIVLVGVDHDERPHFWFDAEYRDRYPEYVALFPDPDNRPHGTTEANGRALSNGMFLSVLGKVLEDLGLARLWVASPTSQLSEDIPQYPWPHEIIRH